MLGPIFVREWLTIPRRTGHYVVRTAYLGFLWVLGLTAWQAIVGWSQPTSLADNARFGLLLFKLFTEVQLALLLFFAALSAASAITQEKDRRTFILLLMTDLRSYEIVLGKLLGSLLQIGLLLAGTVPVLAGKDGSQRVLKDAPNSARAEEAKRYLMRLGATSNK